MSLQTGARVAVQQANGEASTGPPIPGSCMHAASCIRQACYCIGEVHKNTPMALPQEKVGMVTAVNRRGIVGELDYDDGVRVNTAPPRAVSP